MRLFLIILTAVSIAGCQQTTGTKNVESSISNSNANKSDEALTTDEIQAVFSDHTYSGKTFNIYYAPDGSMRGRKYDGPDEGTWEAKDNMMCRQWIGEAEGCRHVVRTKPSFYKLTKEDGSFSSQGMMESGNIKGF